MAWEQVVLALLDDLELQAEGLHLEERHAEVAALGVAQYAEVTLGSRLLASVDQPLSLRLRGGLVVRGRVTRAGSDWALLQDEQARSWLVARSAIAALSGLGEGSVGQEAVTVLGKLGIGSVLRSLADAGDDSILHLVDGTRAEGRLGRVGRDFVEVLGPGGREVVSLDALAAVQERR